jgi:hypothetical protein
MSVLLLPPAALYAQDTLHSSSLPSDAPKLALVPMPREIREVKDLLLTQGVSILAASNDPEDKFAAEDLVSSLKERGIDVRIGKTGRTRIVLLRQNPKQDAKKAADILSRAYVNLDPAMHDEGYVLVTDGDTTYDIAATSAGIYYGAQTIKQLIVGKDRKSVV